MSVCGMICYVAAIDSDGCGMELVAMVRKRRPLDVWGHTPRQWDCV
jgi:hypothetical protein